MANAKDQPPTIVPDLAPFLSPLVTGLEQVGSREIEAETARLKAQGERVIAVHGYPVVEPPPHLVEAASEAARCAHAPPSNGLAALRARLAVAIEEQYGAQADPEENLLVTCGAMHGLYLAMTALLSPGDEVLLIAPCYFFGGIVKIPGGCPVYVEMDEACGYEVDFDLIRHHISRRTKVIVVSSPVNPTGYVYSCEEIEAFISIAEEYNLLLLSDESYDRMLYDGREHISPLHYPEGRARTILVKSFTKSYALPTLRVGYMAAPAPLVRAFRKVLEWMMLHCPGVTQSIALRAMEGPQDWLSEIFAAFEKRRNQFLDRIRWVPAYSCPVPQGGPFAFLNVSRVSNDCAQFATQLLSEYGIPAVGGPAFQAHGRVRIPFGGTQEAVDQLVAALADAASKAATGTGE